MATNSGSRVPGRPDHITGFGTTTPETGPSVLDKAKDVASSVAGTVEDAASSVAHKAQDAADYVGQKASDAAAAVRDTVQSGTDYVRERGVSGMAEDLTELIRRHPYPALFIGFGLGFMLARALRR
jgi:ElaB/YqjD/DUF883 family membrane-anchored ribosome-binding protein